MVLIRGPLFAAILTSSPTFNLVFSFCNGHSGWQKDPQRNPKLFLTLTSKIFWMRCFCRPDLKKSFDLLSRLTQDTPAEVKGHTGQTPPDPKRSPEGSKRSPEKGSEGVECTKVTRKESYLRATRSPGQGGSLVMVGSPKDGFLSKKKK